MKTWLLMDRDTADGIVPRCGRNRGAGSRAWGVTPRQPRGRSPASLRSLLSRPGPRGRVAGRAAVLPRRAGHSAVVALARSTRVTWASWIESPQAYEQHLVVMSPHSVVTAAGRPTGLVVTLFRTDVSTKASVQVAQLRAQRGRRAMHRPGRHRLPVRAQGLVPGHPDPA